MRTAQLVSRFPELSQTFIASQFTGLASAGVEVTILSRLRGEAGPGPPRLDKYQDFYRRTVYLDPYRNLSAGERQLCRARAIAGCLLRQPGRTLSMVRHNPGASLPLVSRLGLLAALGRCPHHDLIHAHFGPNGLLALELGAMGLITAPLVVTFYGYDVAKIPREKGNRVYTELFHKASLVLALGDFMKRQLIDLGCPENRIRIHPLGVEAMPPSPRERPINPDGPLRVLSIARLVEKKGIEYAIRAVAALRDAGIEIVYTIVGDGPLRPSLESLAQQLKIAPHVRFAGALDNASALGRLAESDVLIVPSVTAADGDIEGTPTVIIEAMAAGLPVVSTRHSAIPELVVEEETGLLAAERDVEGLARAIRRLAEDAGFGRRMGEAARRRFAEHHDQRALTRRLIGYYEEVVATAGEPR